MLDRMTYWQKGIIYSIIFTLLISCIFAAAMIFAEYRNESLGLKHACGNRLCTLQESVAERAGMIPIIMLVVGVPLAGMAFIVGLVMQKFLQKE